jgi:hypothetical protein
VERESGAATIGDPVRHHHPGLGWTAMALSRAQVEDLQTSLEFELVKIPEKQA